MSRSDRPRVIAIGIDAADPRLVRQWIDGGKLPALKALLDQGTWGRVLSPPHAVSEAIWPSFLTGSGIFRDGIYSLWPWQPDRMDVSFVTIGHLTPFWRGLAERGVAVGILDVPYAPAVGLPGGFEVLGWGEHEPLRPHPEIHPLALSAFVRDSAGVHPLAEGPVDAEGPHDLPGLERVVSRCLAGTQRRGDLVARLLAEHPVDLFLAVFTEVHHAAHLLWHTVDATHPTHAANRKGAPRLVTQGLLEIHRETDRQIGRALEAVPDDTTVLVFSLRGMTASRGIPAILDPCLRALGLATPKGWAAQSWPEKARGAFRALKQHIPDRAKRLYYRLAPHSVRTRVVQTGMIPPYDWTRTVAFPLPTLHHGYVRLNLAGREAQGIVHPAKYEETCAEVEQLLRGLRREDGAPFVEDVLRLARVTGETPPWQLPDIIVQWGEAAFASPLRLASPAVSAHPLGLKFTGDHGSEGFFILRSRSGAPGPPDAVETENLHRLLLNALDA